MLIVINKFLFDWIMDHDYYYFYSSLNWYGMCDDLFYYFVYLVKLSIIFYVLKSGLV